MGAYQDIMGDLHNLFGRVNEVHVFLDETEPGGYYIEEVIKGNNIAGVLSWIQYSATDLAKKVKEQIDAKVREGVDQAARRRGAAELLRRSPARLHLRRLREAPAAGAGRVDRRGDVRRAAVAYAA